LDKLWQKPSWSYEDQTVIFSQKENNHVDSPTFDDNGVITKSMFNEALMSDPEMVQEMDQVYEQVIGSNVDFDIARHMLEKNYKSEFIQG
jgi:hypothetical protein